MRKHAQTSMQKYPQTTSDRNMSKDLKVCPNHNPLRMSVHSSFNLAIKHVYWYNCFCVESMPCPICRYILWIIMKCDYIKEIMQMNINPETISLRGNCNCSQRNNSNALHLINSKPVYANALSATGMSMSFIIIIVVCLYHF